MQYVPRDKEAAEAHINQAYFELFSPKADTSIKDPAPTHDAVSLDYQIGSGRVLTTGQGERRCQSSHLMAR